MLLIVLILSSALHDIQADTKGQELETIDSPPPKSCAGMTVQTCGINKPRELEKCKICGLINNDRIHTGPILLAANGTNINPPYLYPWMVALLKRKGKISCGGAIINENYILTAAHCLIKKYRSSKSLPAKLRGKRETYIRPHELKVGFLTGTDSVTPGSAIEKIIPHPNYHRSHNNYDVALLKLKENITCNMYRNPICLPPANFVPKENTIFNYTGWGETFGDPPQTDPKKLLQGQGRLVNFSECKKFIPKSLEDTAYCLMGVNSQRACFGDSGGSMFFRRNRTFYTLGVVSMGTYTDCTEDKPFIFSSIPKVVPWITKITGLSPSK